MNENPENQLPLAEPPDTGAASETQRRQRIELPLLLLAAVIVRIPLMLTVPMREAPDEFAHFWVIKFLHDRMMLPTLSDITAGGASAVYGSLPQMGYIPHVLMTFIVPSDNTIMVARFGSLFMGLAMIAAAHYVGRLLFKERLLALALPATLVVHPQLAFLHSYCNNDSTSSALSSLIILYTLLIIHSGINIARAMTLGVLIGWTALAKFSAVAVIPVVVLAVVASTVIHGGSWVAAFVALLVMGSISAALAGLFFARNYYEFNGDIMGTKTMYATWAKQFNRDQNYYLPASHILKNFSWWRMLFFSFWGLFGYMTRYMWRPVYIVYGVLFFSAIAGLLRTAYSAIRSSWASRKWLTVDNTSWLCMLLVVLINIAAVVYASMLNLGGPQGRYLFTSEIPIIALILLGLNSLSAKFGKKLVIAFVVFNALVSIGAFVYLFSMYGFNPRPY